MAVNRLTGFSGFDTESMVKKLMDAERMKMTKVVQDRQYKVWEQDAYRSIIDKFSAFKSDYFDVLNPTKDIRSTTSFAKFTTSVTVNGVASSAVSVIGSGSVQNFDHTISAITQLATKDKYSSTTEAGFQTIKSGTLDFGAATPTTFKVNVSVDGTTKSLEFARGADIGEFTLNFQAALSSSFGSNYANAVSNDGSAVSINKAGSTITLLSQTGDTENSLGWFGVASGTSTESYATKTIDTLFPGLDLNATINGKSLADMGIATSDTLSKMMEKINGSGVGVTMTYDSLADKLSLTSNSEGEINKIDAAGAIATFGMSNVVAAKDASFVLDGTVVTKASNSFLIDGVNFTLKSTHNTATSPADPININLKVDSSAIVDQIKGFVNAYNGLIKMANDLLSEKTYRSYKPLTEEQKKEMSDEDVKLWEEKSKSGVLRGKMEIENVLTNMRQALMDKVESSGLSLTSIGIDTSSDYKEKGKLVIKSETALVNAIENKYSDVVKLFTTESDFKYTDGANRSTRYTENGLGNRLYDIIQDATRTTLDDNGQRGTFVEIAGVKNTASATQNILSKKITDYEDKISDLIKYLNERETYYYSMFARVETALQKMSAQSSMFNQ